MAASKVVERLLKHLDENPGSFYRLWNHAGDTPTSAVRRFREIIEGAKDNLEDDYCYLGDLVFDIIADLDTGERWELGQGILHRAAKNKNKYG